jgi:hypothetical protein
MFGLGHSGMFRRLAFSAIEHAPSAFRRQWGSGYGTASDPRPEDLPVWDGPAITLDQIQYSERWEDADIRAWLNETLDVLTGE